MAVMLFLVSGCSSTKKNVRSNANESSSTNNSKPNKGFQKKQHKYTKIAENDAKKYQAALAMMEDGDYKRAEDLFKQMVVDYPKLSGPHINLGILALKSSNYLQAESYFQRARENNPDNAEIYNYLGVVYRQQGRFSEANVAYQKALERNDRMAKTYLNLGILNDLYLGNYLEAQKNYLKYQQLNPDNKKINAWLTDLNSRIQASVE